MYPLSAAGSDGNEREVQIQRWRLNDVRENDVSKKTCFIVRDFIVRGLDGSADRTRWRLGAGRQRRDDTPDHTVRATHR